MKIAIYGYGNIGRGVELAVRDNPDMEVTGVYTRRAPETVKTLTGVPVYAADSILDHADEIDVVVLCGGSATDLPVLTPMLAKHFHVVDSFDNHSMIPHQFAEVHKAAAETGHAVLMSGGWDPGLFSLNRLMATAIMPGCSFYTFWGRGVSQGHSDAIRRIPGVLDARQYTVPIPAALDAVRSGSAPELTTRQKHLRECYVVAAEGADRAAIEQAIVTMPAYFADYDTTVTFISAEEMKQNHSEMPHGGFVIATGKTGMNGEHTQKIEYKLELDSNPEFTAVVLAALARALNRMVARGAVGALTIFDVAPADLSPLSREEVIAKYL